jgi:hypothetical protein
MKLFLIILFALVSFQAKAGSADFTWTIPNPAFDAPVPADWIIDEYRLYCTIDPGGGPSISYNQVILGYTTDAASYNDIPGGMMSCYMTSWSIKANAESLPSNTVTKFILDIVHPAPPAEVNFEVNIPASSGSLPPPTLGSDGRKIRSDPHHFKRRLPNVNLEK